MKAYQLKITIKNSKPPIWRRCIVPAGLSFSQLTVVIHKVMGWWEGHLSEYTFGNQGVRLLEQADEFDGGWDMDVLDSSEYIIDEFFEDTKSFTYLYDFGDDWYHTVQIEKIIKDYEYDHPMVIKFKGDTPPEDCGGIWGYYQMLETLDDPKDPEHDEIKEWFNEQSNGPYDMELVNQELSRYKKTKKKIKPVSEENLLYKTMSSRGNINLDQVSVPKNRDYIVSKEQQKKLEKAIKDIGNTLKAVADAKEAFDKTLRHTYGDENVDNYYELMDQTNNGDKKVKTLFDYDKWTDVTIEKSRHQIQDLMLNLRDIDIKNYIKYMQIPDKSGTTKLERIRKIVNELKEHPKYFMYLYHQDELETLFDIYDGKTDIFKFDGFAPGEIMDTIMISILMGILEVKEKGNKAQIKLAEDAGEIIEPVRELYKKSGRKIYRELGDFDRRMGGIIMAYGIFEIDKIAPTMNQIYGIKADEKDVTVKTYLHLTMPTVLQTCTDYLSGESHVVMPGLDAQSIIEYRKLKLGSDIDYKTFTSTDAQIVSRDMADIYYAWADMGMLFEHVFELEDRETSEHMDYLYRCVLNGCDAGFLFEELCEIYPTNNYFMLSEYWHNSIACVMDTGLPHLKGYSRYEYYKLTGQRPQDLPVSSFATTGKKSKGAKAHLMYLPEDIQWELYELRVTDEMKTHKEEFAERAEKILAKYPDNLEVMASFVDFFVAVGKKERTEFLLGRIKKLAPELSTEVNRMQNMIKKGRVPDYFESDLPFHDDDNLFIHGIDDDPLRDWDDDLFIPQKPIVRDKPKIGRNDPCPCGSGKKFKKCCMGKGIYD
ncbi:SEC-C metal-binding domain-containing protein [Butyrivibrio sp. INlla16]|uniref:IS1096 element passenger TnpR family protein n=1 Tax=Butyrivibrio sp. INlla16 TaxID=1520807 RepID=UPI000882AB9E|nr:SEC-C metal-binding domain-containing protein [Butyrivibrio sp. INlla16]SDB32264.1 SEC-C motif-containing protein [Butyrivibrio sp. INlla16]